MKLRVSGTQTTKQKFSSTLRGWLPILQANLDNLMETLEPFVQENPFITVTSGSEVVEKKFEKKNFFQEASKTSVSGTIEALTLDKKSLFQTLHEQINPPLFPTEKSQRIAYEIIENINAEGYFEADALHEIAQKLHVKSEEVEKIQQRFAYLEPLGVGALDLKETFLFQLQELSLEETLYENVEKLILNFESIESFNKEPLFHESLSVIKHFRNPPAIDFMEETKEVIPDIFIYPVDEGIEVRLNDAYYPEVMIDTEGLDENHSFVSQKIKEAKDLVDALEMRKATLYKIGLMIIEYQYDFFFGKAIKPMKLKDLADDLGRNPSTISRAIAGKYLSCSRGIIPLKQFFATALEEDISNSAIKEYMLELVKYENKIKPLSDLKLLECIETKFNIKMVRRTITKYRQQFNIASSSERKKLYTLTY
ncbi:RNA polymerase factor sigma-54 [Sulfurospirillum barnesii]|uniref:RNA polymerase, sigma 54 subunit, RpoN/SigL n=1 Tax=Sulfurospirillum barnesii (strain ATCC 700032 / DSM 10660 / SES-3) TaxID=760154 RepID=I3XX62_SULBS|nr:RNA polymerase factor sigma-54 [Sulfurospirillum barnesii]AFL68536.1 RNA polymerase, sigma 54 subunit, RpoN/SigL [Sulfurospirillum barnesii SES-3]